MPIKRKASPLTAGVDHLTFDKREFDCSQEDIERVCRFFDIGKLRNFKKEKGISVSHSHFFVYAATSRGEYALKFYPATAAPAVAAEYSVNRFLRLHHFPTPVMHAGHNHRPYEKINDRLAACYSYINGSSAWNNIRRQKTIHQINTAMLSLKNILSMAKRRISFPKQESFLTTVKVLTQDARSLPEGDQKKTVKAALISAFRTYQQHRSLFTRQILHNNISLTNLLIHQKTVYVLDLSHIREDHAMSDLASLVVSCYFFKVPVKTIKNVIEDHFAQHQINKDRLAVLYSLVKIEMIKEYLKNARRESSVCTRLYTAHLAERKRSIMDILKKMP